MNIEAQGTPDLRLIAKLIEHMKVAMLTSTEADGSLVSRPMMPLQLDAAGVFWFFTDIRSERLERLRQLNLAFSDETRSTYLSLSGHGEVDNESSRIEALWTPEAQAWFPGWTAVEDRSPCCASSPATASTGMRQRAGWSGLRRSLPQRLPVRPSLRGDHGTLSALAATLQPEAGPYVTGSQRASVTCVRRCRSSSCICRHDPTTVGEARRVISRQR